jgi:addiction module HigA family antidote
MRSFCFRGVQPTESDKDSLPEKVFRGDDLTKKEGIMKLRTNPAAGLIRDELDAREIPAAKAARDMAIPRSRLSDIFAGRKGVSADTALRFERYLGISAGLLIRLQAEYDLSKAVADKGTQIQREVRPAPDLAVA